MANVSRPTSWLELRRMMVSNLLVMCLTVGAGTGEAERDVLASGVAVAVGVSLGGTVGWADGPVRECLDRDT